MYSTVYSTVLIHGVDGVDYIFARPRRRAVYLVVHTHIRIISRIFETCDQPLIYDLGPAWDCLKLSHCPLSVSLFSRQLVQEIGDAAQDHVRLGDVGVLAEEVGQLAQQRLGVLLLRRERLEPLLARLVEPT